MSANQTEVLYKLIKDRLNLISRGIVIETVDKNKPVRHMQSFYGGTGPRGRKFFMKYDENDAPDRMLSIPIFPEDHYLAKYAVKTKRSEINPFNLITEDGIVLQGMQYPKSITDIKLKSGMPIRALVEIHPYESYTIVVSNSCRHFENNEKCKFCTTDVAMKTVDFPERFTDEDILEALAISLEHKIPIRSLTISGGTMLNPNETLRQMVVLAKKIREISDLDIFCQLEPCDDFALLKEYSQYAQALGICLDIYDEKVRKRICPGKSKTPVEKYFAMWEKSVEYFGRGNVESHCLIGLGEDLNVVLDMVEKCAAFGVKVTPLHIRAGSDALGKDFVPTYLGKDEEYFEFYINVAKILKKHGIPYGYKEGTGCIGCNGCNAIVEACEYVSLLD